MKLNKMMQAVLAAGILSTGSVMANTTTIWTDSSGNPIRDGHDNCVLTGTLAGSTAECAAPAAASSSSSATKAAKETIAAGPAAAYWLDAAGNPVLDGNGQCIRTNNWTVEQAIEACDADLVKKAEVKEVKAEEKAAPAAVAETKPAVVAAPIKSVNLDASANFAHNSSSLSAKAKESIANFAKEAKGLSSIESIAVEGHTDNTGSAAVNQRISQQRADAVKQELVKNGLDADKINAKGYSYDKPVATNDTVEGRAQNRRVEIHIHGAN